jgi:carbon monoxide dehydrogenase subunit G
MQFSNSFEVPLPPAEAWAFLLDIRRIAPCMPGAELTEVVDESTYKGKVAVRLGPVALSFAGTAKFEDIDHAAHKARVKAQGSDVKGRGGASAVVKFALEPVAEGTKVLIDTDLNLSGSVAQYGRASGMIQSVAAQIISQFAAALREEIAKSPAPSAAIPADAPAAATDTPPQPAPVAAAAPPRSAPAAPPAPAAAKPISGLSLILRALWDTLRNAFRRGSDKR